MWRCVAVLVVTWVQYGVPVGGTSTGHPRGEIASDLPLRLVGRPENGDLSASAEESPAERTISYIEERWPGAARFLSISRSEKNSEEDSDEDSMDNLLDDLDGTMKGLIKAHSDEAEPDDTPGAHKRTRSTMTEHIASAMAHAKQQIKQQVKDVIGKNKFDAKVLQVALVRLKKLWYIGQCRRDYSRQCPLKWTFNAREECEPPLDYTGACGLLPARHLDVLEKEQFAWRCAAEWPCRTLPLVDTESPCPEFWSIIGPDTCVGTHYTGDCSPGMNFSRFTTQQKMLWAHKCGVLWPTILTRTSAELTEEKKIAFGGPIGDTGRVHQVIKSP